MREGEEAGGRKRHTQVVPEGQEASAEDPDGADDIADLTVPFVHQLEHREYQLKHQSLLSYTFYTPSSPSSSTSLPPLFLSLLILIQQNCTRTR